MSTPREAFLRGRNLYKRRLKALGIPIGYRCYLGPDDGGSFDANKIFFSADYEWKPEGPSDFVSGSAGETISYDCPSSAGPPFDVTIRDWDWKIMDQLQAWQAAGTRLRLFAVGEDWIVGQITISVFRTTAVMLKFQFRPMYGCRIPEGATLDQLTNPFLTGGSSVAVLGGDTSVQTLFVVSCGNASAYLFPLEQIVFVKTQGGVTTTEITYVGADGACGVEAELEDIAVGDLIYTIGEHYGVYP